MPKHTNHKFRDRKRGFRHPRTLEVSLREGLEFAAACNGYKDLSILAKMYEGVIKVESNRRRRRMPQRQEG